MDCSAINCISRRINCCPFALEQFNISGVGRIAAEILSGIKSDSDDNNPSSQLASLATSLLQEHMPWNTLLEASKARASPDHVVVSPEASESTRQLVVKVRVLANLCDCASYHSDMEERRKYVSRIIQLPTRTQRRLMKMLERRRNASSSSKKENQSNDEVNGNLTGGDRSSTSLSPKTAPRPILRRPSPNSNKRSSCHSADLAPSSSESDDSQVHYSKSKQSTGTATPSILTPNRRRRRGHSPSTTWSSPDGPNPFTASKEDKSPTRNLSSTPKHSSGKASDTRSTTFSSMTPVSSTLPLDIMSPTAAIDSPETAQRWIQQLQKQNQELQAEIKEMRERENTLQRKQGEHFQEMMKLESSYINQQHDTEEDHKAQMTEIQRKLERYEAERERHAATEQELKRLQEELDISNSSHRDLAEAQERVRMYRERLEEFQDVREALNQEQDAHARALEDVVRLENEAKGLQQARRQLEEYKTRAIESEVKLVECQESLKRLELELMDADDLKNSLSKESIMQKEQLQEMVNRIHEETQRSIQTTTQGTVLGEGLTELNPQVKSELTRLRNENLQLRAFAAKRQDDAVEQLESKLDDSRRLADKYKEEYLNTKDNLQGTQAELTKLRKETTKQIDELHRQVRERESRILFLTEQLEKSNAELDKTKESLADCTEQNNDMEQKIKQMTEHLQQETQLVEKFKKEVAEIREKLQKTEEKLIVSEKTCSDLQETSDSWEQNAKAMEEEVVKTQEEIHELHEELSMARKELDVSKQTVVQLEEKLERAHEHNRDLDARFEEESQSNAKALEATKEILTRRYRQQLDDQATQLNRLLDEERGDHESLKKSSSETIESLQKEKSDLEDRLTQKLEQSQVEHEDRTTKLKEDHKESISALEEEIARVKGDGEEKMNNMIRKGKALINECKKNAKEEITRLDMENHSLEDQLHEEREKLASCEEEMRKIVTSLETRLQQSTLRVNDLTQEADDLQDQVKAIKVARDKLQDDNDRYRRQLTGGGAGFNGRTQQFEKLQKEYQTVVEENRKLRREVRSKQHGPSTVMESSSRRDRGSTITQLRQEYEDTIASLNDEKRELVMRNTAAMAEVDRAEKRTWEREQEMQGLKTEMTTLKLELERLHMNKGTDSTTASLSSFNTGSSVMVGAGARTPPHTPPRGNSYTTDGSSNVTPPRAFQGSSRKLRSTRSPTIDRALREKEQHENMLRQQISSLRRTPPRKQSQMGN